MSSLNVNSSYRTVFTISRITGIPLPWRAKERPAVRLMYATYSVTLVLFLIYKITCGLVAMKYKSKFEDVAFGFTDLNYMIFGAFSCAFYFMHRSDFTKVIENVDLVTERITKSGLGREDTFVELYSFQAGRLSKYSMYLAAASVTCPLLFVLSVPFMGLVQGNYRQKMPAYNFCPYEKTGPGYYEYLVIITYLGFHSSCALKLGHEILMLGMYEIQYSYYKYLSNVMKSLSDEIINDNKTSERKLLEWIKLHQIILKNTRELIKFYSPMIIAYYLTITCIVPGGLYYQLNGKEGNQFQRHFLGCYMFVTMFYLFLQCNVAQSVTTMAESLALDVYSLPWYRMDKKYRGLVLMIIARTSHMIHVDSYGSPTFRLNRETYQAFVTKTVSAYMAVTELSRLMTQMED